MLILSWLKGEETINSLLLPRDSPNINTMTTANKNVESEKLQCTLKLGDCEKLIIIMDTNFSGFTVKLFKCICIPVYFRVNFLHIITHSYMYCM